MKKPVINLQLIRGNIEVSKYFSNFRYCYENKGTVLSVMFSTSHKYYNVTARGMYGHGDHGGMYINFCPEIFEDGKYLMEDNLDAYVKHPNYWLLELKIESPFKYFNDILTPLKYKYVAKIVQEEYKTHDIKVEPIEEVYYGPQQKPI